ncbi:MAG: RNA pyrophosphohydrolase [Leptospirales bacterium]|nr:RNA pyrophosphohydrolase [Leptospirales bacterium]
MSEKPYRPNVGIVVFNASGLVLAGERIDLPGIFQLPQGGLEEGEDPAEAAKRELFEETGLKLDGKPLFEIMNWLTYDFPEQIPDHLKKYRGQKQKWFFFFWDGNPETLQLDHHHEREFSRLQWMHFGHLARDAAPFKKDVYQTVYETSRTFMKQYLAAL